MLKITETTEATSPLFKEDIYKELPILTEAERHKLLVEWNDTATEYPKNQCIHELFEAQVARTPEAIAIVFEEQCVTYGELNVRANQLAHYLQYQGVGPEVLVGICVERSIEMVIALLGILKAGGAYVPLDPAYPYERLAFMIEDAQVSILLTQKHLIEGLSFDKHLIYLDADWPIIAQQPAYNVSRTVHSDNVAYVIYTSGSTGQPKGVMVAHRNLLHSTYARISYYRTPVTAFLLLSSIAFDSSVAGIFWTLCQSGRLVLLSTGIEHDPEQIAHKIADEQISHLLSIPSLYHLLLEQAAPHQLLSLQTVIVAGEPCSVVMAERHYTTLPDTLLFNEYGPTECTVWASVYQINPYQLTTTVPIGRPIANTQIYVLDDRREPVSVGMTGELYIGGDGLARGYLHRPELTDERFIPHPFSNHPHIRLYKTGDLARYREDGTIEYLGRLDHQVKIRGFRIELGEIEATLDQHPAVQRSVVVAYEDRHGDKHLVAYLLLREKQTTMADVRSYVIEKLPAYMVPSAFVTLEAFPLTPNGKLDRDALPPPDFNSLVTKEIFSAPLSTLHLQLKQIWENLLNVNSIGMNDNFFYLGGHSLLAAQMLHQIEHLFGKKISFATLFAGPTIEHLAKALQSDETTHARTPIIAIQPRGSQPPFFYLHGAWNSDSFYCFQLAQHLGTNQPFYVMDPYSFEGLNVAPTIEDMAAAHIQSLRVVQPDGPYHLGGFCNGGLIAYEMARQLRMEGQKVDLLVLIDPAYPRKLHVLARHFINYVGGLTGLRQSKQLECFLRLRHIYKYLLHQRNFEDLKEFRGFDNSLVTLHPTTDALLLDNNALLDWIIAGYDYDTYPDQIMMLRASEESYRGIWRRKAIQEHNIEVRMIPGTHIGCRTDHAQDLAKELHRCLNNSPHR